MLSNLFGHVAHSSINDAMYWTWAMKHPYLYFGIEIMQNTPIAIALYFVLRIAQVFFKRG
jgi:hypothetical protein